MATQALNSYELLYSLFNQYVFSQAKANIESIDYYFRTNPETQNSQLVYELVQAIRDYPFESIDMPLFSSIFAKCNKTELECEGIMKDIIKWKSFTKDQIIPAREFVDDLAAASIIKKANTMYKNDPSAFLKYIKNSTFVTADTNVFTSINLTDVDINALLADNPNDYISSRYKWINDTFEPYPGYERGQMILVSAAPGTGKTLWLMSEAVSMATRGYRTLYISLGDNKLKDFIVRMSAIYTGDTFPNVHRNFLNYFRDLEKACNGNLEISINAANKVTAEEIVSLAMAKNAEVVIVDYDGNLKGVDAGDNMYHTFGAVYATLNELVLAGKLLFIASQPVKAAWSAKVIEMEDIGESARKQQTADMIIGIGKEKDSPNHLHTFKISKSRRGEVDVMAYTIRLKNGRFKEIPKQLYDDILHPLQGPNIKRDFTEAEIDNLIMSYNNQFSNRNNNINNQLTFQHNP